MAPDRAEGRGPDRPASRARAGWIGWRVVLWVAMIASWGVMVAFMWDAVTTVPSAERLAESRLVEIPGARTFITAVIFSALEVGVVLVALWPWRPAYYGARLAGAALALLTWFVMTTPMGALSRMDWVHRRWLAFMFLATVASLIALLLYRLGRRLGGRAP